MTSEVNFDLEKRSGNFKNELCFRSDDVSILFKNCAHIISETRWYINTFQSVFGYETSENDISDEW